MKLSKEKLKQIIKEELEAVQQEGFMDSVKSFFGGSQNKPAMKGFNQGPSSYSFKLVDEKELQSRKENFLRSLGQTRASVGSARGGRGNFENYFFGKDVKTGMIDLGKLKDDIAADLAGIDAKGYVAAPTDRDLAFPGPIDNPGNMADYVGNPMRGWRMIAKYLSGKINRLPVKNKDLFAVQQAYAERQLE